jgi:hypothetical protein
MNMVADKFDALAQEEVHAFVSRDPRTSMPVARIFTLPPWCPVSKVFA